MLVNMKMREFMPLAESTKVQLYISQVFVGELGSWGAGQQMDVFWKMQERAFSRKTIVGSTPQDHKKIYLEISKTLVDITEDYDEDGFSHKGQSDHFTVLHQVICSIQSR